MLAKNAESSLAGLGCWLIGQPRQLINSETEFAKASQGPADEFIVMVINTIFCYWELCCLNTINTMSFNFSNLSTLILSLKCLNH